MGTAILRVLADTPGATLAAALERPEHPRLGEDALALAGLPPGGVALSHSFEDALVQADAVIDFTAPVATARHAALCAERGVALVVGTTGLGEAERRAVEQAAERIPIVWAPNMSLGVNVLFRLVELAAKALGDAYDVEIVEAHHRQKKDAPSGTALRLAEGIARALGRDLDEVANYGRHGQVGARPEREIGILTMRGGDVVGDHTAYFLGMGERVELTHRASSRETFARGAVRAAQWLAGRAPGLYDMQDVLGLR